MNKQTQNSTQLFSIGLLTMCLIATMALFFFSCKKNKELQFTTTETYYTVTFNSNGGSAVNPIQIKKRNAITLPDSPTKTDFVFGGWFTDDKTFKNQFDPKTLIIINFTLYAKWDVPEYTVTFDSKGGSAVTPIQVKKGATITLPASPTKTDFVFGGWYTDKEASVSPFSATTTINANLTLYAKWDVPEYTVTFDSKGGSAVTSIQAKKGATITLPASPTKTDFVFGGWYTDKEASVSPFSATTTINANLTLYAKWDVPEYTVTFDSKGGSTVAPIQAKKGATITLPASPTKTDFVFGGWYTDKEASVSPFSATTTINANLTLYAKWDVPEYKVTFDSKGGSTVAPIQAKKGATITLPASPTKTDFVFGGWYTDSQASATPFVATTPINANLTLYAKWDVPEYTVSFDSKGGSAVAAIRLKKGATITLPPPPTKAGYTFGGWYTDSQASATAFVATTPITANLTLYAKWNENEVYYTVSFDSKGGSAIAAIQVKKGNTLTLPAAPTKAGYTFDGWYTDSQASATAFVATTPITANLTLYAKWNENEVYYTVSFDSKGGSAVAAIQVKKGNTLTLPAAPTKAGYTFDGWYTDSQASATPFEATTPINADLTLYAKWNENEVYYTVSFDSKGGSAVAAIQVKKGNTLTLPAAPTKAGYTFDGWYTDSQASATPFEATTPITANLTLYAKWNENEVYYTVSFDSKGGSAVAAIQVKKGNTATLPAAPTKAGYTFDGWYTDSQASATPFEATTPITANLTLYAKWNENEVYYTVSFDSKGGSAVAAIQVKKGNTVTLPAAPTKAGYTFDGWYTDSQASANPFSATTAINANLTLYAKWNENEVYYTVSFDSKGGSAVAAIQVKKGNTVTLPAAPTKAGYTFDGWYTDSQASANPFSATTAINANLTLYAKWNENEVYYTVSFDSKGGSAVAAIQVKKGNTVTLPVAPTKAGYTFVGWYTDSQASATPFEATNPINANLTLYAKWEEIYTITFDSKEGSAIAAIQVKKGNTVTLPPPPTRDGYTFGGWYTDSQASANPFSATTTINANLTLYAKWEEIYTITFDSKGGPAVAAIQVKKGNTVTLPAAPTRDGYTFGGWYTDKEASVSPFSATTTINANLTLYAKWEEIYTITFDSKEGSAIAAIQVKKGNTVTLPPPPTRDGYTFGGWYTDSQASATPFEATNPINANLTLYAKWEEIYTITFDSKGGPAVATIQVKKGNTVTLPPPPTRDGYTFGGWYTDKEASVSPFSATTTINANLTLYAKWEEAYTITFDSKGSSAVAAIQVKKGNTVTLPPPPTRDGYTFGGWYTDSQASATPFEATNPINANLTLYAKWEEIRTITFDSKGGPAIAAIQVKKGNTVTLPVAPTRDGYTFGGWYTDKEASVSPFSATTTINANLTLYAKWEEIRTITFDSKEGSAVAAIQVKKGNTVTLPAAPTRDGYTFGGWYTDKEASVSPFSATTTINANLTLYAKWEEIYTITFDSKEGSAIAAIQVKKGNTVTLPPPPTRDGYTFGGWYTDSQASATPFEATNPINANLTLYAKWEEAYTITFDSKEGSAVAAIQVKKGNTITLPSPPTRDGYTFGGWYTDKEASVSPFSATTTINANLTLYAKWEEIYTITFDSKEGSAIAAIQVKKGNTVTLPPPPTKAGYTFGGWYTDKEASVSPFSATTTINANLTLYAKWEEAYTITFDSKEGSAVAAIQVKKGNTVTLPPPPTRDGYTFGGWYTDSQASATPFEATNPINANLTLYAKWEEAYTITFDSKEGSAVAAIQVKKGNTVTLPAAPTRDGYTFGGWYTDKEASVSPFSATTTINANLTLYAKWEEIYTITFDSKEGSAIAAIQVKKGNTVTLPAAPTRDGYTFGGWYTDKEASVSPFSATTTINANLTLYAKWEEIYTITFDSKGGSAVAAIQVKEESTVTLPPPPTKAGYTFGGWYIDSQASALPFEATNPINANLTLYAKWNENEVYYTVSFDSKGGSAVAAIQVKKGNTLTLPAAPIKAGYTFDGWYTDSQASATAFEATTPITANLTLYAKWNENEVYYTVSFDSKGGSAVAAIQVKKGNTATLPAAPTKAGYTFVGWYTDSQASATPFEATTPITANLTLYAKWNENEVYYTVSFDSKGGSAVAAIQVKKGNTVTLPAAPTKAGYTFDGWYTDSQTSANPFSATTAINANLTLYAKWNENEVYYTVSYDSKGGSAVAAIQVKKGNTVTLPAAPTKAGYTFDGWYTDSQANASPFSATTPITANLTLYAKWNAVAPVAFTLSSTSFPNGGVIPPKYAHRTDPAQTDRLDVSPQLSWANAPAATTSFLIIMDDLDFLYFNHWTVYNIPTSKTSLTENDPWLPRGPGNGDNGIYCGPFPDPAPGFNKHTYKITIFALDLPVDYFNSSNFPKSETAARNILGAHILASSSITGTFETKL